MAQKLREIACRNGLSEEAYILGEVRVAGEAEEGRKTPEEIGQVLFGQQQGTAKLDLLRPDLWSYGTGAHVAAFLERRACCGDELHLRAEIVPLGVGRRNGARPVDH